MNEIVPLSLDNELRPRRDPSATSTGKMLAPILQDIMGHSLPRLLAIADRAEKENNPILEAQLRAKLVELGTRLLKLERSSSEAQEPAMTFEDIPDWGLLPQDIRENFEKGLNQMEERYGDAWHEFWIAGQLDETN